MHSHHVETGYEFDLSGGVLCLDFANTISWRAIAQQAADHLGSYDDLVAFAVQAKVLSSERAGELRVQTQRCSSEAENALQRAVAYRECLYRAFSALAQAKAVAPDDLTQINHLALEALTHRRLAPADGGYRWEWEWNGKTMFDNILWAIAQSAADLLTSSQLEVVRMCEAPDCAWLFLDQSRNRSRRWCDMKVCGNRQKARRHYQRTHR